MKYIALDDGHGMETAGKRTPIFPDGTKSPETGKNFMHENEFNRAVVKYAKEELERHGFKILLTAPTDADTPLAERVALANKERVDLFISVHANALTGQWGEQQGIETFTDGSVEGMKFGKILHKYVMQGTQFKDRGVKDGSHLYVLRKTTMPAVLVECGFMDNLREAKLLLTDAYRRETAQEIAKAVCEFYGVKYMEKVEQNKLFKDYGTGSEWSYSAVKQAVDLGLITGFEDGTFRPTEPMTREQVAVVVMRLYNVLKK